MICSHGAIQTLAPGDPGKPGAPAGPTGPCRQNIVVPVSVHIELVCISMLTDILRDKAKWVVGICGEERTGGPAGPGRPSFPRAP